MTVKRQQVPYVWVAEVAHKESRWMTLWTTCRLTRADARSALEHHPAISHYYIKRIVKFTRAK